MVRYPSLAILNCWKGNNVGRDNHPRARQQIKLQRKKAIRESYDRILIVCEVDCTPLVRQMGLEQLARV